MSVTEPGKNATGPRARKKILLLKRKKKWKLKPCNDDVDLKYLGEGRAKSQRKRGGGGESPALCSLQRFPGGEQSAGGKCPNVPGY